MREPGAQHAEDQVLEGLDKSGASVFDARPSRQNVRNPDVEEVQLGMGNWLASG